MNQKSKSKLIQLAEHVLAVARENSHYPTCLHLRMTLYFVVRYSPRVLSLEEARELYDEKFSVARYGPWSQSLQDRFYSYGANPIIEKFEANPEFEVLDEIIRECLNFDTFRMVHSSQSHTFWRKNSSEIDTATGLSQIFYDFEDIIQPEFLERDNA